MFLLSLMMLNLKIILRKYNMEKLTEKEIMLNFVKKYSNDSELGSEWRKNTLAYKGKQDELCMQFPNDYDLGSEIRKIIRNKIK